jgi:hypothetical protein
MTVHDDTAPVRLKHTERMNAWRCSSAGRAPVNAFDQRMSVWFTM